MLDKIINIYEALELYEQELEAVVGGKNVPVYNSDSQEDIKFVGENSRDSVIQSMNKITTAFHLISLNI